jgi:inhibitor of the pro-sigma K processing machinery
LPQIDVFSILAIFLAIGAVYVIGVLLVLPIKIIVRLVINGIIGAIALFAINIFSGLTGLVIGINPITALVAGFLGIPGIILLIFLQYFL